MAQPVDVTYTVASGPINAGRFAGGAFAGAVALGDAAPGGSWAPMPAVFSGAVALDDAEASGAFLPQVNARVEIWGQSNAIGIAPRSGLSASPLSSDPGLVAFDAGTFERVYIWVPEEYAYVQLAPGTNNQSGASTFGPEFGLAVRWMRETTSGNLYIGKSAASGSSIDYFAPVGGYKYGYGINQRTAENNWLAARGITIAAEKWMWVQGEADRAETEAWYAERLNTLLAALVSSGFMPSNTAVVLSRMNPSTTQYGAGVDAAKVAAAAAAPERIAAIQFPHYVNADNLHYNARGQVQHAYDAYAHFFGAAQITV